MANRVGCHEKYTRRIEPVTAGFMGFAVVEAYGARESRVWLVPRIPRQKLVATRRITATRACYVSKSCWFEVRFGLLAELLEDMVAVVEFCGSCSIGSSALRKFCLLLWL